MLDLACLSATVYGRVQGVYFRAFVHRHARALGLTGFVRNLPNGMAVEARAEGEKERLNRFVEQLKVGPPGARVNRVDSQWSAYTGDFHSFEIRL